MSALFSIMAIVGALGLVLTWSWGQLTPLLARLRAAPVSARPAAPAAAREPAVPPRREHAPKRPPPAAQPDPSTEFIDKDELFAAADAARSSAGPAWPDDDPATEFLSLEQLDTTRAKAPEPSEEGPTQVFSRADLSRLTRRGGP